MNASENRIYQTREQIADAICNSIIKAMGVVAWRSSITKGQIKLEGVHKLAVQEYHNDPLFNRAAQQALHEILLEVNKLKNIAIEKSLIVFDDNGKQL
jgi:hypothetical protein